LATMPNRQQKKKSKQVNFHAILLLFYLCWMYKLIQLVVDISSANLVPQFSKLWDLITPGMWDECFYICYVNVYAD